MADIRSYPGSTRHPQYNKTALQAALSKEHIKYIHLPALGGKGKNIPGDVAMSTPFHGYRSYMKTKEFYGGITRLEELATSAPLAYMCAEADWANCHRALVSDHLKASGWKVLHILTKNKLEEHPDRYLQGKLFLNN